MLQRLKLKHSMAYLLLLLLLLLLLPPAEGGPAAQVRRGLRRRHAPALPPPYLHLPVSVDSQHPLVEKEHFSPAKGTGKEPLPQPVREVLLPARTSTRPPSEASASVRALCTTRTMQVQVEKSVLGAGGAASRLRLGTCGVSDSTVDHLYFEYDHDTCGTKKTFKAGWLNYTNVLRYDPPQPPGPIRRAQPFTVPIVCYFYRYQYSYKVGYTPKVQMRKVFKQMKNGAKFILTPRNARWERLSPSDQYVLGEPMYFEAEALPMSHHERLYIQSCHAAPEKLHTSTPRFPVVTNFGCMVESKDSRSRFIPHQNNVVRFSVDAFLFKGVTGQHLYMHCTMSVGSAVPTQTAKSCNYDTKARRWVELSGSDSVCDCCDSNCSSAASTVTQIISSKSWSIEPKVKPTITPKRKTVSSTSSTTTTTTTTTMATTTAAPQPKTTREQVAWRWASRPEATGARLVGKVEKTGKELEWPFGGGGVTWFEEEGEEKQVKGSAVVEEEEKEKEEEEKKEEKKEVTERHRIFEDFFDFDK